MDILGKASELLGGNSGGLFGEAKELLEGGGIDGLKDKLGGLLGDQGTGAPKVAAQDDAPDSAGSDTKDSIDDSTSSSDDSSSDDSDDDDSKDSK